MNQPLKVDYVLAYFRYFILVIGCNKALLIILTFFLPESKLWMAANAAETKKTVFERLKRFRPRPHQGLRRVSITITGFLSRSNSSRTRTLPGLRTGVSNVDMSNDNSVNAFASDRKRTSFSTVRRNSIQYLQKFSYSFKELFSSKKMLQITLIQSIGWVSASFVLQGAGSTAVIYNMRCK